MYKLATVVVLIIIAAIMMVIGRGHTIYLDSKTVDYNGKTYKPPYKIVVNVGDEQIAKLYNRERGMTTCIGQKLNISLKVIEEKGGEEKISNVSLNIPYNMDGVIINLPAYLAGLPEEAYLTKFVPIPTEEEVEDEEPAVEEEIIPDDTVINDL